MPHFAIGFRGAIIVVVLLGALTSLSAGFEFELLSTTRSAESRVRQIEVEDLSLFSAILSVVLSLVAVLCGKSAISERRTRLRAEKDASFDHLTGLPNRRLFEVQISKALEQARDDGRCALLLIDLDRFKQVNDTLGHGAGDALLVAVAKRIRKCVPVIEDCARLGGDEFAVILRDSNASDTNARAIASWLAREIARDVAHRGRCFSASASIGTAFSADAKSAVELLEAADRDMYRLKNKSRLRSAA